MLRHSVPTAGGHSRSSGWNRNIRKRSCGAPGCALPHPQSAGITSARSGTGGNYSGSADETRPKVCSRPCRRHSPAGFRIDDEPEWHLPGHPTVARKAEATWHVLTRCREAQCAGAYGRNRLESQRAIVLALGGGHAADHLLRDSAGDGVLRKRRRFWGLTTQVG
jgi:hypothetical protein